MKSTAALWAQFDRVFAEADKLFAEADRLMREAPEHEVTSEAHNVRFKTKTFMDRLRLCGYFMCTGCAVLFKGQAILRFKHAKSPVQNN